MRARLCGHLPTSSPSPACVGPSMDSPPAVHTTRCWRWGETWRAVAPSCTRAEGLQGNYLLMSPQPSPLSYQLKHFRVQAKKPKSISKKSLRGQNTNIREGVWSREAVKLGRVNTWVPLTGSQDPSDFSGPKGRCPRRVPTAPAAERRPEPPYVSINRGSINKS